MSKHSLEKRAENDISKQGSSSDIFGSSRDKDTWRGVMPEPDLSQNTAGSDIRDVLQCAQAFTWEWDLLKGVVQRHGPVDQILGFVPHRADEFISRIHPEDQELVKSRLEQALCGSGSFHCEFRFIRPDGHTIRLRDAAEFRRDEKGQPRSLAGICLKNCDQPEQSRPLPIEGKFRIAINHAPVGIAFATLEGVLLETNPKFAEILGFTPEELSGKPISSFTHPDDLDATHQNMRTLLAGEVPHYIHEKRYLRKDGNVMWSRTTVSLIKNEQSTAQCFIGVIEDITSQKTAEAELQLIKDRQAAELQDTRRLHELSTRLLNIATLTELLQQVLDASIELTGTDRGNIQLFDEGNNCLNMVVRRGFSDEFYEEFKSVPCGYSVCGVALQNKQRIIMQNAWEDERFKKLAATYQKYGFVAVQSTPLTGSDGRFLGMLSTHFKIPHHPSERELQLLDLFAQQAVRVIEQKRNEELSRRLFELAAAVNRATNLASIYEASLDAICGCYHARRASILLYDEDNVMRFKAWRGLSDGYRKTVEGHSPWKPDDLDPRPVCVSNVKEIELEPHLRQVIENEGIQSLAFIPIVNDRRLLGKFMIYYDFPHNFTCEETGMAETIASQIAFAIERHQSGEALERLVTERTRSLKEAVQQMEEFSYTVSHDLRAPLRAMQGYSQALMEDYGATIGPDGHHYLKRLLDNSTRLDKMILDILRFSKTARTELTLEPIDLNKLVHDLVEHYPVISTSGAKVTVDIQHNVLGHEPSLVQVISNLLTNAVKFVAKGVIPRIHVWTEKTQDNVSLFIQDNGIGIAPEHQHRLFNMFERLHTAGNYDGTGVGLAIVRKAVERMGGSVGVKSEGTGSCFWVQLRSA